jgi:hypothetical protein
MGDRVMAESYSDDELVTFTKSLLNVRIQLPKLKSKADYKSWLEETELVFGNYMPDSITFGQETHDNNEAMRRPKYADWYA